MGIFSALYQIGSMSEVSDEEANTFMKEFEDLVLDIDAPGIFLHNTTISLPMFIPGFGVAWGLFSAWSTGFAFSAITSINPQAAGIPALAILYLSPFGLSRSFILIRAISKKIPISIFVKPTIIEVGIVIGLLLVGGFLEDYMIKLVDQQGLNMPGL